MNDMKRRFKLAVRRKLSEYSDNTYFAYVNGLEQPDLSSTILVEIPAYHDPLLMRTIHNALNAAGNPDRIHFAVCHQGDDDEALEALGRVRNCRVTHFAEKDVPGLCAARYEAHRLYDCERYVMHIDSHMAFSSFWDVALIDQYERCPDGKHVLTEYCPPITDLPACQDHYDSRARVVSMCGNFIRFTGIDYMVSFSAVYRDVSSPDPVRGAFIGGHFVFGRPDFDDDVPPDPEMYFSADESSVGLRFWTHGYDVYGLSAQCVYHLYNRPPKAISGNRFSMSTECARKQRGEHGRLQQLFGVCDNGIDFGAFGLGTVRTRESYYEFSGVNFRTRVARRHATDGLFTYPRDAAMTAVACIGNMPFSNPKHAMYGADYTNVDDRHIAAIITATECGHELVDTVESILHNADHPGRLSVIIAAQNVDDMYATECEAMGATVVRMAPSGCGFARSMAEQYIPDDADYVLYAEEHMFFSAGWDTAMVCYARYCGDRCIISDYLHGFEPGSKSPYLPSAGLVTAVRSIAYGCHANIVPGRAIGIHRPVKGAFVTRSNMFMPAHVARSVRHSPDMMLYTVESSMSYRYWCGGFDVYHSPQQFIYHQYKSGRTPQHAKDADRDVSSPRLKRILGLPGGDMSADMAYELGTARSLRSFESFAGISLGQGTVTKRGAVAAFCDDFCLQDDPAHSCDASYCALGTDWANIPENK